MYATKFGPVGRARAPKEMFCNTPPSPILTNTMFIKIHTQRKEFSMILVLALGVGKVVARGITCTCDYVAKIASLQLSVEKNLLTSTQQSTMTMTNIPLSSAEVTSCNE